MRARGAFPWRVVLRHPVRWLAPVYAVLALVGAFSRGGQWRGNMAWAWDFTGAVLWIMGALVAGSAALAVVRWHASDHTLVDALSRPWRQNAVIATAVAGWASAAYLLVAAVLAVVTLAQGSGWANPLVLVPQVAYLFAGAGIGVLIGQVIPHMVSALVAALTGYGVVLLSSQDVIPARWTDVGGATASLVNLSPNWRAMLPQAVFLLALFVVATLIYRRHDWSLRRSRWAFPAALVAVAAGAWTASSPEPRYEIAPYDYECLSGSPEVCVLPDNPLPLQDVAAALRSLDAAARAEGSASQPDRYEQVVNMGEIPDRARGFDLDPAVVDTPQILVRYVVHDVKCLTGDASPDAAGFVTVDAIGEYLASLAYPPSSADDVSEEVRALRAMPVAQRHALIRDALVAAADCRYEDVPSWP